MKKYKLFLIIGLFVGLLVVIFFWKIPCGGRIEGEGGTFTMWDGTCPYGPTLIKNIQNGHFFLPFGWK